MAHIANKLISKTERKRLYESGGRLLADDIEAGMFVIGPGPSYSIYSVVARSRPGEELPDAHHYSMKKWTQRDCVCFSTRGAPRGAERVARVYRDVTSEVSAEQSAGSDRWV